MNLNKENVLWLRHIINSYVLNLNRLKNYYVEKEKISFCDYHIKRSNELLEELNYYLERIG